MTIERLDYLPDHKTLFDKYIQPGKPVIIERQLDKEDLENWTPSGLKSIIGDMEIVANSAENGKYIIDPETGIVMAEHEHIAFSEYMDRVATGKEYLNLQHWPLLNILEELKENCWNTDFLHEDIIDNERLWIGAKNTITSLHYDTFNNFIIQYYGAKKVTLFHANQIENLYCHPLGTKSPHLSRVNINDPDLDKHPDFAKAERAEVIIKAGDILFIPSCCFHQVENLDLSISVAIWWDNYVEQLMLPGITRYAHAFYNDIPIQYSQLIGVENYEEIFDYCENAKKEGDYKLASILACAGMEEQIRRTYLLNCGGDEEISDVRLDIEVAIPLVSDLHKGGIIDAGLASETLEMLETGKGFDTDDDSYFTKDMAESYINLGKKYSQKNKAAVSV